MIRWLFTSVLRNVISLIGVVLTTIAAVTFVTLFTIDEFGHLGGYAGIVAFVIIPGVFVLGLVLIPIGLWRLRVAERKGQAERKAPVIDLNVPRTRNIVAGVGVLTVVNVVIVATGTYKGIETMESTEFCGGACHSVMSPEYTTYSRSPHARVRCTQCHIGPGANWFVKSKLSGSWQLVSVALDLYPRPIPTPVENLRPARETCEQCHWPTKFVGERLKILTHYDEDEANTAKKNVLLLKVGGVFAGKGKGIHWHVDPTNVIRYKADKRRQYVAEIELTRADGSKVNYKNHEAAPPAADGGVLELAEEWRTMDCVDCHNRPTHVYEHPKHAVEQAMTDGHIDTELPFIRREALRIVQLTFKSHDEAKTGIPAALTGFYAKEFPDVAKEKKGAIEAAAQELVKIYTTNVFPQMNITWGTYPSFLGHPDDEGGCYRCHSSDMLTADDKKVSKKCDLCHEVLAEDEEEPEILEMLAP